MRKSKSLLALVIAVASALNVFAQQGTTHNFPLTSTPGGTELLNTYLRNYLGYRNYFSLYSPPYAVGEGQVVFVEVNDYWRGNSNMPDVSSQVNYGVKSMTVVSDDHTADIPLGKLFFHEATTNRFFFAIRTSSPSGNNPMAWYNEFSSCIDAYGGSATQNGQYSTLSSGSLYTLLHSCTNIFQFNHFVNLHPATTIGETYPISVFLYIPTNAYATTSKKSSNFADAVSPKMFLYVSSLTGSRVVDSRNSNCNYAARLYWDSSFSRVRIENNNITTWDRVYGGVKEENYLYRRIPGMAGYDEWHLVRVDGNDYVVDTYKINDKTLPNPGEDGYTAEYYVQHKVVTYDGQGNRTKREIGTITSNEVSVRIPGSKGFLLSLAQDYVSKFSPRNYNPKNGTTTTPFKQSTNHIANTISASPLTDAPSITNLTAGDVFTLHRYGKVNSEDRNLNVLTITERNGNAVTYTLNGSNPRTETFTSIQGILDLIASFTDEFDTTPGELYDAAYQIEYVSGDGSTNLSSNLVCSKDIATSVETELFYRSGTPDELTNAPQELYTYELRFKPVDDTNVAYYNIWLNAEEPIARLVQTDPETFSVLGKNADGKFTEDLGTLAISYDHYVHYRANVSLDKKANPGETDATRQGLDENDLFFTLEVVMNNGNSYGNVDRVGKCSGEANELVISTEGTRFHVDGGNGNDKYRAYVTWNHPGKQVFASNHQNADESALAYYTVYRKLWNENVYRPLTSYRVHNPEAPESAKVPETINGVTTPFWQTTTDELGNVVPGYVEVTGKCAADGALMITPEMMARFVEEEGFENFVLLDFVNVSNFSQSVSMPFPAQYYVTAHYASRAQNSGMNLAAEVLYDNLTMKNSDVVKPTISITTVVEDVNVAAVSEVVKTIYYNLQGMEVKSPTTGQIVVARYLHADGSITSKLIRK